jgi:hypothetical protein
MFSFNGSRTLFPLASESHAKNPDGFLEIQEKFLVYIEYVKQHFSRRLENL